MNNSDNLNNPNKMYSNYDPNNNPSRKMLHINTGYDKNQKKGNDTSLLTVLLLLIVIGVGGYYAYKTFVASGGAVIHLDKSEKSFIQVTYNNKQSNQVNETGTMNYEKFYETDIGKTIESNGLSFTIKTFTETSSTITLNAETVDALALLNCPNNVCPAGTTFTMDGTVSYIFETNGVNEYIFNLNLQNKK